GRARVVLGELQQHAMHRPRDVETAERVLARLVVEQADAQLLEMVLSSVEVVDDEPDAVDTLTVGSYPRICRRAELGQPDRVQAVGGDDDAVTGQRLCDIRGRNGGGAQRLFERRPRRA